MLVRNRVVVASVGAGGTTTPTAGSLTLTSRRAASTTKKQQPTPKSAAAVVSKPSLSTPTNTQEKTTTTASTSTSPPAKTTTNRPFQPKNPVSLASLGNLFKMSRDHELLPRKCNIRHNPTLEVTTPRFNEVATDVQELTENSKRKRFGAFSLPDIPAEKTVDYRTTTQEVKDMFRNMFNPSTNAEEDKMLTELKEQANAAAVTASSKKKKGKKVGRNSKDGGAEEESSEGSTPSRMLVDLFAAAPPSATAGIIGGKAKQSKKPRAEDLQEGVDPSKADINAGVNTTLDEMRTRMAMRKLMGLHFHTYGRQREMETLEGRRDKTLKELSKGDSLYYRVHTRQDIEDHLRKKQAESGESEDPLLPSVIESYHARVQRLRGARAAEGDHGASNSDDTMGLHEMKSLAERKKERRREELKAEQAAFAAGVVNNDYSTTTTSSPFALGSDFKNSTNFEYSLDAITPADIFNRSNLFPQTENHIVVKTPLMRMLEERQKRKRQNAFMQQMKGTQKNPHQTIAHSGVTIGMDPRDQPRLDAPASSMLSPLLSDEDAERVHKGGNPNALLPSSAAASPPPTKAKDSFRISSASITADFDPVAALRSINETSGGLSYKGVKDVIVEKGVGSGAINEKFFSKEDFVNRGEIGLISKGAKPREMSQQYQESTKGARTKAAQKAAELAAATAASSTTTTTAPISVDGEIDEDDDAGSLEDEWDEADMEAGFTPDMDLLGKKKNAGSGGAATAGGGGGGGKAPLAVVEEEEEQAVVVDEEEDVEDVIATLKRLRKEDEQEEVSAVAATTTSKQDQDPKVKKSSPSSSFNKNKKQQSSTVASRRAVDRLAASSKMTTVKKKK